jgi:hypothetical protein
MPDMNPPKKSLRPKARPKKSMRPDDEGSTRHPSGNNIYEDQNTQDTQKFMMGGMAKQGYMDGGDVRRGDVRDNPKRGKCY